jgi:hypothetical protein
MFFKAESANCVLQSLADRAEGVLPVCPYIWEMSPRRFLLFFFLLTATVGLRAQHVSVGPIFGVEGARLGQVSTTFRYSPVFAPSEVFLFRLPAHVRANPRGYSSLCRLELRIEERLPVGIWVKVGERPLSPASFRSNAEVRFKLLKF